MDPVTNPFSPGEGARPPALAGRDEMIENARVALKRVAAGRHVKSMLLLGLRGAGKNWRAYLPEGALLEDEADKS